MSREMKERLRYPLKFDAKGRCEFIFQRTMNPCPNCGSYDIKTQTPVDTTDETHQKMEGTAFIMCWNCFHKGPAVDCSKMTRAEVGKSKDLMDKICEAWNSQRKNKP